MKPRLPPFAFLRALKPIQRWQAVGLVAALILLSWLDHRASAVDPSARERYLQDLYAAAMLNARLDAEVLASQQGLVTHFDGLTQLSAKARATTARLTSPPRYLARDDLARVHTLSATMHAAMMAKLAGIEDIKGRLARLRNSLAWFPTAADRLLMDATHFPDARVVRAVAHYASHVMRFLRASEAPAGEEIAAARSALLALPLPASAREQVENLIRHGDLLVAEWPALKASIAALRSAAVDEHLQALNTAFEQAHAHSEIVAGHYRKALYGVALLLILWLAALFFSLLRAQQRLRLHATVFENAQEGITLTAPDQTILDVNPAFTRITGYTREEVIGKTPRLLQSGRHDAAFYRAMWQSIEATGQWQGEIWNRNKAGAIYPEHLSITAVKSETGTVRHYIGIFSDISRLKAQEQLLSRLAYFDALTQLPNRTLLLDRAAQAMAQARRTGKHLAVCLLDLDGFKPINDAHGHEAGDRVLIEIARRMQGIVRSTDTVARFGGDEFVLLLTELDHPEECFEVLQRLQESIARPFAFLPASITVGASIGITFYPDDDADADTLLRHADQAMYLAKQAGKHRYQVFDVRQHQTLITLHARRARLAEALAAGEFTLYYQPKVDMRLGKVVGAEALLRWHHPQQGVLAPGAFLSLIEHDPLIVQLGAWVIETVLTQLEAWRDAGLELDVSVNIAARQLQAPNFVSGLEEALSRHPRVARQLELEVLENAALEDFSQTQKVIDACHALGLRVALDDFGTGYSSLAYLKRLPVDALKIDQSFVRDILVDADDRVIVRGIIGLAKDFELAIIAEGVESIEHGCLLLQMGCTLAQGYGIGRPMPAEEFTHWLRQWQPPAAWQQTAS